MHIVLYFDFATVFYTCTRELLLAKKEGEKLGRKGKLMLGYRMLGIVRVALCLSWTFSWGISPFF